MGSLMALGRFEDLCIGAVDPPAMAAFCGNVLRLHPDTTPQGASLTGDLHEQTIWVNHVPEVK